MSRNGDNCLPQGEKKLDEDSDEFTKLHKSLARSKNKFARAVLQWHPQAGATGTTGATSVSSLLGSFNLSAVANSISAVTDDSATELHAFLDSLTQEHLTELKKKVVESATSEELKDDIMGYVLGVKDVGEKRLSAIEVEAAVEDDKDEDAAELGFTISCGPGASELSAIRDRQGERLLAEAASKKKEQESKDEASKHVVDVRCLGGPTEKKIEHHLLPGIRKEAELRRLLVEMPLPRLRKLLARFQESDDAEAIMDDVVDLWKLHIFKSLEGSSSGNKDKVALARRNTPSCPATSTTATRTTSFPAGGTGAILHNLFSFLFFFCSTFSTSTSC